MNKTPRREAEADRFWQDHREPLGSGTAPAVRREAQRTEPRDEQTD